MPRKACEQKRLCHVCSKRRAVGVWIATNGYKLAACGEYACVVGYTPDRVYKGESDG